jgi:hypothetical protein
MALMQMDYSNFNEAYFISSFIIGLRDGIKHYIIPHSPQSLSNTYWKAKELEKGILQKKAMLTSTPTYPKHHTPYTPSTTTKPSAPPQAL